jgi:CHAT domain-containing protein
LEIIKVNYGENHIEYVDILSLFSILYSEMGNYDHAKEITLNVVKLRKQIEGENSLRYAQSLYDLGVIYSSLKDYDNAIEVHTKAHDIRLHVLGDKHINYARSLHELANIQYAKGNYNDAETLYLYSFEITKNTLGVNHPEFATVLRNLSGVYLKLGDFAKSSLCQIISLSILRNSMNESDSEYIFQLEKLAKIYGKMENHEELYTLTPKIDTLLNTNIQGDLPWLMLDRENLSITETSTFNSHKSFYLAYYPKKNETSTHFYNIELATKSIILKATTEMRKTIENSGDTSILKKYDEWRNLNNFLANQNLLTGTEKDENFAKYIEKANSLKIDLLRFSNSYNKTKSIEHIHWQDVQAALKDEEAAIEFSSFQYHDGKRWCDSTMYVALVLRKSNPYPTMIPLFEARQLDILLQKKGVKDAIFIDDLYQFNKGSKLYNLLWSPLEASLKGVSKISFSASGLLHQISFAALTDNIGQNLTDKYLLNQVNTTALIAIKDDKATDSPKSIALFGGIDYNAGAESRLIAAKAFQKETNTSSNSFTLAESSSRGEQWNYLAGTKREVEAINTLASSKKLNTTVYLKQNALEEAFNNLQGIDSPDIIHIATHGFFFPDLPQEKPKDDFIEIKMEKNQKIKKASNPLMRSGLLMAGANDAWSGKETTNGLEDGILTAYEAANIPIPNTQLVVLSACETGLGDIKGNEGVFGLQRAFQTAGAKYVLMSLWKIPDSETAEFMILFYETMFSGKSIPEAFRVTQLEMSKKYKNEPYKWAAFVLIGG